ncbi:MAG: hypothetical protein ABIP48_02060 [Planctomycetota bacterium]
MVDTSDTTSDTMTLTDTTIGAGPTDNFVGSNGWIEYASISSLVVWMGSGGNHAFIESTHAETKTFVKTGEGNDVMLVRGAADTVNDIRSRLDIDGQDGQDIVTVDDGAETAVSTVTVTHKEVVGDGTYFGPGGKLTYDGWEELTVDAGRAGDTVTVTGTSPGTETNVNTGDGIDLITVAYNDTVDVVRSLLTIDGGGGPNNALSLLDSVDATPDQVTITDSKVGMGQGDSFFGPNGGLIYSNLTQLNLVTGVAADLISIQATNPGTNMLIGGGAGDDVFLVDSNGQPQGGTVDLIQSKVTLIGGLGSDVLTLDDGGDVTGDTVTVTPTGATAGNIGLGASDDFFGAGGSVVYNELSVVALRTSDVAADIINVAPSPKPWGTQFTIDGNHPTAASAADPGDRLNFELTGVTSPLVTVLGFGAGVLTSASHAPVGYLDIELIDTLSPAFDLVLQMNFPALGGNDSSDDTIRATRGALLSGDKTLQLEVNGSPAFVGLEKAINSLTVMGSTDQDTFDIVETVEGLPSFPGTAIGSHTNGAFLAKVAAGMTPKNVGIHFNGGTGPAIDQLAGILISPQDAAIFNDLIGPLKSGVVNFDGFLTMSYVNLEPILLQGAGGSLLIDATLLREMTQMTLLDLGGGVYEVSGDGGFETTTFSGFDRWVVRPPDGVRLSDGTGTGGILPPAPSLDLFDVRWTPTDDTPAVRIRDQWFERLAMKSDLTVLLKSPPSGRNDSQSDEESLGDLADLLAEMVVDGGFTEDVESDLQYEDVVETLAQLV